MCEGCVRGVRGGVRGGVRRGVRGGVRGGVRAVLTLIEVCYLPWSTLCDRGMCDGLTAKEGPVLYQYVW